MVQAGQQIGRYQVEAHLRTDETAETWRARDPRTRESFLLRLLAEGVQVEPILKQARRQTMLRHPNLLLLHDVIEVDGRAALLVEDVNGPTLAERLAEGPVPRDEALACFRGVAEGLARAHELGFLHLGLRPARVLLPAEGPPRVADLGLPVALGSRGTERDDVHALGALLYELVLGRPPVEGQAPSDQPGAAGSETLPRPLASVIDGALQPDPEQRTPDVATLLERLEGGIRRRSTAGESATAPFHDPFGEDQPARRLTTEGTDATVSLAEPDAEPEEEVAAGVVSEEPTHPRLAEADTAPRDPSEAATVRWRAPAEGAEAQAAGRRVPWILLPVALVIMALAGLLIGGLLAG